MDQVQLTSSQLVDLIDQAGDALGWSGAYQAMLSTTIGAAFTAMDLDEDTDTIGVTPPEVPVVRARIIESSLELARAPRTATSYASAWGRLAGIAYRWATAGGEEAPAEFWEAADLRDKRVHRRAPRRNAWELSGPAVGSGSLPGKEIVVELSTGTATITLPETLSETDRLKVVQAVLNSQ